MFIKLTKKGENEGSVWFNDMNIKKIEEFENKSGRHTVVDGVEVVEYAQYIIYDGCEISQVEEDVEISVGEIPDVEIPATKIPDAEIEKPKGKGKK